MTPPALAVENLSLSYGSTTILDPLSFCVEKGEMVSLLGPSGAGKTSLLKAIAGLHSPAQGRIRINGVCVDLLPPEKRDVVMVFQKPLLFPYMNVEENIAFGLAMQKITGKAAQNRIDEMLGMVALNGFAKRKVHSLSGGQQQRVSLARALVLRPGLLLLDEPFASLDANLREKMRDLIADLQKALSIATVFVTHDQTEALMLSHRMGLILQGKLRQFAPPQALYHQPEDLETARFFGPDNLLSGTIENGLLQTPLGTFQAPHPDGPARILLRPEAIRIASKGESARVKEVRFEGAFLRIRAEVEGSEITFLSRKKNLKKGDTVFLTADPENSRIFFP